MERPKPTAETQTQNLSGSSRREKQNQLSKPRGATGLLLQLCNTLPYCFNKEEKKFDRKDIKKLSKNQEQIVQNTFEELLRGLEKKYKQEREETKNKNLQLKLLYQKALDDFTADSPNSSPKLPKEKFSMPPDLEVVEEAQKNYTYYFTNSGENNEQPSSFASDIFFIHMSSRLIGDPVYSFPDEVSFAEMRKVIVEVLPDGTFPQAVKQANENTNKW